MLQPTDITINFGHKPISDSKLTPPRAYIIYIK